jgi:GNAT superfamily N-acetyltransferase
MSEVQLRDGSRLEIRAMGPADKAALAAGFERLSELSRYRRFLSPTPHLTSRQLTYLTDVDHHDHEALVAVEPASRDGLGVARFVRSSEDPEEAECAVAVADDWHRRGLGTLLLRHLAARAREERIERFTGLVLRDNEPMRHLLDSLGQVHQRSAQGEVIEVCLLVPDDPLAEEQGRLANWLRAAAMGKLDTRLREAAPSPQRSSRS